MNCKQTLKSIPHYLDDELPGYKRAGMESHLRSCSSCASHLARFREIWSTIDSDIITTSNPYFFTRLTAKMHNHTPQIILPSLRLKPVALFLTVIIPLFIGIWLGYSVNLHNAHNSIGHLETITEINNMLSTPGYTSTDILLLADLQNSSNGNNSTDQ